MKAMSQILLNDQQRMIMSLNKRTLLEDNEFSSEPMTETPENSEGETVAEKLLKNSKFEGVLHKAQIDGLEANRRAILSVTKRRFLDEEVCDDTWSTNFNEIVEELNRKVYEDPKTAHEQIPDELPDS